MKLKIFLFALAAALGVAGQNGTVQAQDLDFERIAPKQVPARKIPARQARITAEQGTPGSDATIVKNLQGVVLTSDHKTIQPDGVPGLQGVKLGNVPAPAPAELQERIATEYVGKPLSLAAIDALSREIVRHYRANDRPLVDVVAPEQDVTSGVLQLVILEGRRGQVRVEGNRFFRTSLLDTQIRTEPGEPIHASRMAEDLDWMNKNPFREVNVVYTPGQEYGTTDIVLETRDRFPLRVFTGYENTGNDALGDDRWFAGFNWGNVFGLDHQLSYQFTTSSDFQSLRAHSATYVAPLPWRHTFSLFGSFVETDVDFEVEGFTLGNDGESWQVGGRYRIPLPTVGRLTHDIVMGFDFKRTNNNLEFGGQEVFDNSVDVLQGLAGYEASLRDAWGATTLVGQLLFSPGDLTGENTDEAFQTSRAFASADYIYGRATLQRLNRLPKDFSLLLRATGQWADDNLFATEQFGVGGYNTVRGYAEREARGDSGYLLTAELRTPSIAVWKHVGKKSGSSGPTGDSKDGKAWEPARRLEDSLQFLAFCDYGVARIHDPLPNEEKQEELCSVGLGLRYSFNPYVSLRFDYGWQLIDTGLNDQYDSHGHLGVVLAF